MLSGGFSAMRRIAQNTLRGGGARTTAFRGLVTVGQHQNRDEIVVKLDRMRDTILGAPWGDYWMQVQDMPFWEAEWEKLNVNNEFWRGDEEVGKKIKDINEMFDCLYVCEDVRDYINELLELNTRSTGLMGTVLMAGEKVDNMEEAAKHCAAEYDKVLEKYPQYKAKIDQTIGYGLALLRQKYKFDWSTKHRFFF